MITLCLDLGNTRSKAALFGQGEMTQFLVLPDATTATVETLLAEHRPAYSMLSSVVHHDPALEELLAAKTRFHKLSAASRLPFTTPVGKPETIGADRLALVAAAAHAHPGQHSLVIGLGSCVTYNFLNEAGEFLGGSITPGMMMRFRAMHEFTALLPMIKPTHNFPLIGYDTATNMQGGVVLGMAAEMDGIADRYRERYLNLNVLLTGGDMAFFQPHLKTKIFADPHLLYKGLYAISEINR